ncbi:hypothetical protein AB4254_08315 [Vibrio breoganii]
MSSHSKYRFSDIQKESLKTLVKALKSGHKEVRSANLNFAINQILERDIHPNNFRPSCKKLVEQGLLMRKRIDYELYVSLTPEGFDKAIKWLNEDAEKLSADNAE